jgi:nitrogen fixation NifU-like protein
MDELYREYLLDHYKNPHNKGEIKNADIHQHDINISCGDEVEIYVKLDEKNHDTIKNIKFEGRGCVICMASTSILTDEVIGKKLSDIHKMDTDDLLKIIGLKLTPARIKCAMLPLVTIKKGVIEYESKKISNEKPKI